MATGLTTGANLSRRPLTPTLTPPFTVVGGAGLSGITDEVTILVGGALGWVGLEPEPTCCSSFFCMLATSAETLELDCPLLRVAAPPEGREGTESCFDSEGRVGECVLTNGFLGEVLEEGEEVEEVGEGLATVGGRRGAFGSAGEVLIDVGPF